MIMHDIHPNGDVILTLYDANQPFAEWQQKEDLVEAPVSSTSDTEEAVVSPSDGIQFRLSSAHLTTVSKYFQNVLTGPWKEAPRSSRMG